MWQRKEEAGREERGREVEMASPALSALSVSSEDPAAMPGDRDLLSLWACGISPSSNLHCLVVQWVMITTSQEYITAEIMLNTRTEDAGTTRVWIASPPTLLLVLTFIEPPASGRWATDIRRSDLPGLCRSRCSSVLVVSYLGFREVLIVWPHFPPCEGRFSFSKTASSVPSNGDNLNVIHFIILSIFYS